MGVTIEQYRCKVGSHANFIKQKEIANCLKSKFWNAMLILFFVNACNLPALKHFGKQYKSNNESIVFFIKACSFYYVHVPLLLKLCNDVEENPGPTLYDIVDVTRTVCAEFSQGCQVRFGQSAGKQCVAMSLTSIVYNQIQDVSDWDSFFLNTILISGNSLYTCLSNSVNKDLLLLTDVPEMISANGNTYNLHYSESYTGALFMTHSDEPYYSLESALNKIFLDSQLNYNYALLTVACNTVAIFKSPELVFKIFDSHSRDLYGMPHSHGKSVLVTIDGIQNLVIYFQNVSPRGFLPFEIKGVSVSLNETQKVQHVKKQDELNKQVEKVSKTQESTECREKRLSRKRQYDKKKQANETPECREKRLAMRRKNKIRRLEKETPECRAARLSKLKQYNRQRLENETPECREERLAKKRQYRKKKLETETPECRAERLCKQKQRNRKRHQNEAPESRANRLARQKQCSKQRLENETPKCREKRLSRQQEYEQHRHENESSQAREVRLIKKRQYNKRTRESESSKSKEKRLSKQRSYLRQQEDCKTIADLVTKFHRLVSEGPLYICTCCNQLWYKHSVCQAASTRLTNPDITKHLQNTISVDNIEWLCQSCNRYLKKNKVPPCAIANGMKFPEKPNFFDLNELECRLLAPRLAFQKILQAPRGKQFKIHGNVVNVPADVTNTVNMLPRLPQETGTIKVQLKRRLQYKSSALSLNVRPHKVLQAAAWLTNNSPLYQEEGITLNETWNDNFNNEHELCTDADIESTSENLNSCEISQIINSDDASDDNFSEDEAEIPAGVTDTMLTATDFLNDTERQKIYNVAPGEGNRPLSIFRDQYSEELAYPGIFLGQKGTADKQRLTSVYYSEICKSELRRSDRRAAMCVENIFFKTKKLQMKILLGKSQIALRKCKGNSRSITAGQLKHQGCLERLIKHDEGYKFLRALRGSPPYFEKAKKDLFAMIRQLGPATLFCSFSSAETKWIHLLRILGKLVDNKNYSDNDLENLNWDEKCRLIQSDPVTCARHFDYQFNTFLKKFLITNIAPLGKIKDWFYRVEYQQRGSPHIHMMIWLEGAPVFGIDKDDDVTSFIDQIITCQKPKNNPGLLDLVNRQIHRHSHTCRKKSKNVCRFNYPQPPMRTTTILFPLEDNFSPARVKTLKQSWRDIKKRLNDLKDGEDITFDQLLSDLEVPEETYILAIRSSLNCPTIFLKRKPNELRVNNYNAACLSAWRANMDIQFILDVYACAMYIVSYISKAQKGMSELLRKACAEAKQGNASIKQQVRDIGNKFLNSVEISAQEAVYILLQLPMRKSSRQVVFINTSPPDERVELLKPMNEIEAMPDESEEIHSGGLLKRYTNRPLFLQNVTLADWAAWYDNCGKPFQKKTTKLDIDKLPLETSADDENNDDELGDDSISEGTSKIKKRSRARIIRSAWFNIDSQPEKHYRELIMLFTPWKNEETDLIGKYSSYKDHYQALEEQITQQMNQYAVCADNLNEMQQRLNDDYDEFDSIAPVTQHVELQDEDDGNQDLHPDFNETYDLSDDLCIPSRQPAGEPLVLNEMQDYEYRTMVQKLNKEQKEFFTHTLQLIKTSDKPFYSFLSGGGGVGKSHLTKSIYQAALKYYNSRTGEDFHQVKILLLAPTGKAAYLIKGNTIHSTLAIPASRSLRSYKPLDSSRLNTLRCKLGGVKLILLDEVSMVGNNMFTVQINNRLKDIKGSKEDFGGVSIIGIGDLFQLPPVFDGHIFNDIQNSDYGILAPNLWQKYFRMYELQEIMRQRESRAFAEILNRLREGKHTESDIVKIKERCVDEVSCPKEVPRLFTQNDMVDDYNDKVYHASTGNKYIIIAQDSVIGANTAQLRDKILRQIPYVSLRNTKQLARNLAIAEGERTEIALNVRTDDGLTNGASNIIKLVQLNQPTKPSGIIWVQFDDENVGVKTRQDNRHLYVQGIEPTWTPIKPVTTQFNVGKTKSAQAVRKQFPLRLAAAKTVHRSQGDTQSQIVVNLKTKRPIPHMHYVALSRVTTIEGLYVTDLCENRISVDQKVVAEMEQLRTERRLQLCFTPLYDVKYESDLKVCFLNARSLHKHIDDVRHDFNFTSSDIAIFTETRISLFDNDELYTINGFQLFRNDGDMTYYNNGRPYGGTIVYSKIPFVEGYPYSHNVNGIEFTVVKVTSNDDLTIIAVYRSPKIPVTRLCSTLVDIIVQDTSHKNIFIGDFNVDWLVETRRQSLYNVMVKDNSYRQLISTFTTDNQTIIDHIYTNTADVVNSGVLETYFSDHKAIWTICKTK